MGCFGYMCNGCGLSVRGGETSVVKHIRHGEVMGEATGVYDTYGGVEGNDTYRSNDEKGGVNSHHQVWQSEFNLQDSAGFLAAARIYKKRAIAWSDYCKVKVAEGEPALTEQQRERPHRPQRGAAGDHRSSSRPRAVCASKRASR